MPFQSRKRFCIVAFLYAIVWVGSGCRLIMNIPDAPDSASYGDGVIGPGEICDGIEVGGKTCEDLGFGPGLLVCNTSCDGFLTGACAPVTCGDGVLDDGETCDGAALSGETCENLGFYPGELACLADCSGFDTSGCGGSCGDGVLQENEVCDSDNLQEQTCRTQGYFTGMLACHQSCLFMDTSACWNATFLNAGYHHTCTVLTNNHLRCWGNNEDSQLGDGTTQNQLQPVDATPELGPLLQVAGGLTHTCALRADSTVWCWGDNSHGQLGNDTGVSSQTPVQAIIPAGVTAIAASTGFTCAVSSGYVFCWGINSYGQLGNGSVSNPVLSPVTVANINNAVNITAGWAHACAIVSGGSVKCWGDNTSGQLGDGTTTNRPSPVAVQPLNSNFTNVVEIDAGGFHTCARLSTGAIYCWGDNQVGQLGDGTIFPKYNPTPVNLNGSTRAISLTTGDMHTCAVMENGSAMCWGYNQLGQLGDGTTTNRLSPTFVPGSNGLVSISAGANHTCALNTAGHVWCWGSNEFGQLGNNGSTEISLDPVEVLP